MFRVWKAGFAYARLTWLMRVMASLHTCSSSTWLSSNAMALTVWSCSMGDSELKNIVAWFRCSWNFGARTRCLVAANFCGCSVYPPWAADAGGACSKRLGQ